MMNMKWLNPSFIMRQLSPVMNIGDLQATRFISSSSIAHFKTRFRVNEYLLDRSTPASEILSKLTEEDAARLEKVKSQYQFLLSQNELVPKVLKDKDYLELLCLSLNQQRKFLNFLAKKEFMVEKEVMRREERISKLQEIEPNEDGPASNRFHTKFNNKIVKDLQTHSLFQAMVLKNQYIAIDASFEQDMYRQEIKNLAKQIQYCYAINKNVSEPYQMVISGLKQQGTLYQDLHNFFVPSNTDLCPFKRLEDFPFHVTDRHYLDMFKNKRIIYLSPDSTNFLRPGEYDHDAVYIIGGIVDKSENVPLTLSRARREGIEHRSLPLDRYVEWKSGRKSLPINQVFQIMQMARDFHGDWAKAICETIPTRSLLDLPRINFERNQRRLRQE